MNSPKEEIIPAEIYTKDYYLSDNEGCKEFLDLDAKIHDKFERALRLAQIQKGERVLDIGCGRGELVYYSIKEGADYAQGIDYSAAAIEIAQQTIQRLPSHVQSKAHAAVGTAENFPYSGKFDVIFFLEIAEHMHDWQLQETFKKFSSILTDRGRIIMITPNYLYERYLQPIILMSNIPGNILKWPLRILRGKYKPKNFKELLGKIFKVKIDRGERNRKMHCNVLTPNRIKKHLKEFNTIVYCEDHSINPISLLFKKWLGRDIIAVAKKKGI